MAVLEDILERARRRHLINLSLQAITVAVVVGASGVLLLLVLGTQMFDWYWPVVLASVALAVAFLRSRRDLLSPYQLAQLVDRRLGLNDRLSTLFYFRHIRSAAVSGLEVVERQAAESASSVDADRAIPITRPRWAYAAAALLALCVGMLGLRYGVLKTLDLGRPVISTAFAPFIAAPGVQAATHKSVIQEHIEKQLQQMAESAGENPMQPVSPDRQQDTESAIPSPDGIHLPGSKSQGMGEKGPEGGESGEKSQKSSGETGSEQGKEELSQEAAASSKPKDPLNQSPKNSKSDPNSENSLPNRLRDALANLMSKLTPKSGEQSGKDQQQQAQPESQAAPQQAKSSQGMQSQGKSQAEGQSAPDSQEAKEGSSESPGTQSRSSDKSGDKPGGQDAKSGMGQQDGDKALRDAEQLAAMGKISEIFGKRAQQITGEVTVEVPGGKQQLRTEYSQQRTRNTGYAAEVNRDEIPLMYQTFVQRYFEEVRKLPSKAKSKASPGKSTDTPVRPSGPQPGTTP